MKLGVFLRVEDAIFKFLSSLVNISADVLDVFYRHLYAHI